MSHLSSVVLNTYYNSYFNIKVYYFKKLLLDLCPSVDIVDFWLFMFYKVM